MKLSLLEQNPPNKTQARRLLISLLQSAHAGEKAAANAYYGHAICIFLKNKQEKKDILEIYQDELDHRTHLMEMLSKLGAKPSCFKEVAMYCVGAIIAVLCQFGGWFIPFYGAGKLESQNIEEYELAARLAFLAGELQFVDDLLDFAEKEWDHELYFRTQCSLHWMSSIFPIWPALDSRDSIRLKFAEFVQLSD